MASVGDTLRAAVEAEEEKIAEAPATAPASVPAEPSQEDSAAAAPDDKPGRTAGRARDEKGRLLPGNAAAPDKPALAAVPAASTPAPVAAAPRPRPSSWSKDMWDHWDKFDPQVAEYILKREGDYAKGVSTYKAEAEHARKWNDAVAEFLPVLQQHGLDPVQHTQSLMRAHQTLALGSQEQKLAAFDQMARDYLGVPLSQLVVQGQDGRQYWNQNIRQTAPQQQAQPDIRKTVSEILEEERARQEIAGFERDTEKYPHYQQVKETMAGLLQSGLADDLGSAYEAALRHPRHADIYESIQEQKRQADEQAKADALKKQASVARNNAVSVKSSAPTVQGSQDANPKNRRAVIEAAFEQHAGGGRV